MKIFDTTTAMAAAHLSDGQLVQTKGYSAVGDLEPYTYLVKTAAQYGATPDETTDFTLANGNVAVLQSVIREQQLRGNRNKIINGAMQIAQWGAGPTTSSGSDQYVTDRFKFVGVGTGSFTAQQSTDAPDGFNNSLLLTVSVTDTPAAGEYYYLQQLIEGYNVADLGLGTATAKTFTMSFWVKSSITGTFSGSYYNNAVNRSYPFTYTINSASTWEQKTITIDGDVTGTWATDNTIGLAVTFSLGTGSAFQGTADTWGGALYFGATGETNWISNSGATFAITGVQLEVGNVATPFEQRSYGQELALCQRYYQRLGNATTAFALFSIGYVESGTVSAAAVTLPTAMRTASYTFGFSGNFRTVEGTTARVVTNLTKGDSTATCCNIALTVSGNTTGNGINFSANSDSTAYLEFDAEL